MLSYGVGKPQVQEKQLQIHLASLFIIPTLFLFQVAENSDSKRTGGRGGISSKSDSERDSEDVAMKALKVW